MLEEVLNRWRAAVRPGDYASHASAAYRADPTPEDIWQDYFAEMAPALIAGKYEIRGEEIVHHLGILLVMIDGVPQSLCFVRVDGSWHLLESIKNWTAGSFWDHDALDAMDELNGRSISWGLAHSAEPDDVKALGRTLLDAARQSQNKKRKRSGG